MLNVKQISILDAVDLIGKGRYAVKLSPFEIAKKFNLQCDRSFDDLGYFDFLCVEYQGTRFGFFQHTAHEVKNSYISIAGSRNEILDVTALLNVEEDAVHILDDEW